MTVHIQRSVEKDKPKQDGEYLTDKGYAEFKGGYWRDCNGYEALCDFWLQPVEIPDGEVTFNTFHKIISKKQGSLDVQWGLAAADCFALHIADKARAVDGLNKINEAVWAELNWLKQKMKTNP